MNLTRNIQEVEQNLKSLISEKDKRISQLLVTEERYEHLQQEYNQEKLNAKKELDSLQKEIDAVRTQQMIEHQKSENELRDLRHQLQTEFYKERCQLETEWRNERIRLESETREERTQRLRLESQFRDERSERLRFETELHNSDRKLDELTLINNNDKSRISQLESELHELEKRHLDRKAVAVGTSDIPDLDLQLKHTKVTLDFEKENINNKKKVEELNLALDTWKSKVVSFESQLNLLTTKYDELQNERNKVAEDMKNASLRHNEIVDNLNRDISDYQKMAKQTEAQNEDEIRKAKAKEIALMEEIETLKSKILHLESSEGSLQHKIRSDIHQAKQFQVDSEQMETLNEEQLNSKMEKISGSTLGRDHITDREKYELIKIKVSKADDQLRPLTLTEIDSMIMEQTPSRDLVTQEQNLSSDVFPLLKSSESQDLENNQSKVDGHQIEEDSSEKQKSTDVEILPTNDLESEHQSDWLSPSNQNRTKRRKMGRTDGQSNFQHTLRPSVSTTSTTPNFNTRSRFKIRSKSSRRSGL
ncbi:9890_t:CDS:10 [Acaulospora colombiana]|uniref:9890_t:CDS:1 n=1 Tax=Acaulospora colombiana TaxID=27376 RepID=A0ACA9M8U0_9GLOM|nr:9890_t:CDS:10 [Acaulospora colombiana]